MTPIGAARPLEVTARAVQRHWGASTTDAVSLVGDTGLLRMLNREEVEAGRAAGARTNPVFDAESALELGRRPFVDEQHLTTAVDGVLLVVQQSRLREDGDWDPSGTSPSSWRRYLGWSAAITPADALLSASGWWPVPPEVRPLVRGVVSTVGSFVVTVGVVPRTNPVLATTQGGSLCRFDLRATTSNDPLAVLLRDHVAGRRVLPRRGSSFLLGAAALNG